MWRLALLVALYLYLRRINVWFGGSFETCDSGEQRHEDEAAVPKFGEDTAAVVHA